MLKTKTIKQKAFIPAAPKETYQAFVDSKKHSAFTGSKATGIAKVGGKFTAWDGYIEGKYLELKDGKNILQEWKTSGWPEGYPPSLLELTFKPKKKGTEINLIQTKVPAEQASEYRAGWTEYYWNPLKEYFLKLSVKSVDLQNEG